MKKIIHNLFIFSKISTSFILLLALLTLGYFFYEGFKKQENIYKNGSKEKDLLQNSISDNLNQIQNISKKIDLNEQSLVKIEGLLNELSKYRNYDSDNNEIKLILQELDTNLKRITLEVQELKNQTDQDNTSLKHNSINKNFSIKQKNELINLIIIKFENNLNFSNELNLLEQISNEKNYQLFEKINILLTEKYNGNLFLKNRFKTETNNYLLKKSQKNSNSFLSAFVFPYIKINPSKKNFIKDDELIYINDIEKLINNKEYKKSLLKLKLLHNYDIFYKETLKQLNIVNQFNELILKVGEID